MKSLNEFLNEGKKTWKDLPTDTKKWTYDMATGDEWAEARAEFNKKKPVRWSMKKYKEWIKSAAQQGGANNAYDVARNIDPKLLKWVKQNVVSGDETPLERIQWDIEMYA